MFSHSAGELRIVSGEVSPRVRKIPGKRFWGWSSSPGSALGLEVEGSSQPLCLRIIKAQGTFRTEPGLLSQMREIRDNLQDGETDSSEWLSLTLWIKVREKEILSASAPAGAIMTKKRKLQ